MWIAYFSFVHIYHKPFSCFGKQILHSKCSYEWQYYDQHFVDAQFFSCVFNHATSKSLTSTHSHLLWVIVIPIDNILAIIGVLYIFERPSISAPYSSLADQVLTKWEKQHWSESKLALAMACFLMTPSHYLNQCRHLICEFVWCLPESNFTKSAHENNMRSEIPLPHLPGSMS